MKVVYETITQQPVILDETILDVSKNKWFPKDFILVIDCCVTVSCTTHVIAFC